jgi:hypothetical protein
VSGSVRLLLYDIELDSRPRNPPSNAFELLGNGFLDTSCVAHGHGGGLHLEHRSTGAHSAEIVDGQ